MRTTFDLPDELVERVKVRAIRQHRRVKDKVVELLRLGLSVEDASTAAAEFSKAPLTLPLFECHADAPASRMTGQQRAALLTDSQGGEDLERVSL